MPDRDKVSDGLCDAIGIIHGFVPKRYWGYGEQACRDAIALLKEQETDAEIEGGGRDWWYVCGECRAVIDSSDSYCSKCGRRIRWKRLGGDE